MHRHRRGRAGFVAAAVLLWTAACGGGSGPAPTAPIREAISVQQAYAMTLARAGDPGFVVLDVRTPGEFAGGHIEDAHNLDVSSGTFQADVAALPRTDAYLVYCLGGSRSAQAVDAMASLGFLELYDMLGGITAWTAAGYPTVP